MKTIDWPKEELCFDLKQKTAVITGGTKGIGKAVSVLLARHGANVVISSRHQAECDELASAICAMGGRALGMMADVSKAADIKNLIRGAKEAFGTVDILVNNAGVAITEKILDAGEDKYDRVLDTNLKSVYLASKEAAAVMKDQKQGGVIIQMASIGGLVGTSGIATYCASKAGVISLTKTMALEWSRYGIRVNAVCPGYVRTEINAKQFEDEQFLEKTLKQIPMRRLGRPEEIAQIVLFLASDLSSIMTGTAVVADMGSTCK